MKVKILREAGYTEAMLGLSLSHNQLVDKMPGVAAKLAHRDGGHNKFLESMAVWLDVTGPRYWWAQFDTYRVGVTKQSESTMHTLMKRQLQSSDFERAINLDILDVLHRRQRMGEFRSLKNELPEGFLQRRIICTNYKALRNIYSQRHDHKLHEWHFFCDAILAQLEHGEFIK